jgi:hypothetical protein
LNYMCTCDSMMSTEIVTDDNVNKVTRPADWYFSIQYPETNINYNNSIT